MSTDRGEALRLRAARPLVAAYRQLGRDPVISADLARWATVRGVDASTDSELLGRLVAGFPEFRNLFYYRLETIGHASVARVARRLWRPMPLLEIACASIGPGLVISHGHGTILTAERIGRDCWIHHQVTLGSDYRSGLPTIGDGVFIGVGAKVIGPVKVGDGARIGANAVVVNDVSAGATAVGVPAQEIRRRGEP